jgi:hypothetical protein
MDENSWNAMLEKLGISISKIREERYDYVIHLVTAAIGAPEYFNFKDFIIKIIIIAMKKIWNKPNKLMKA